MKKALGRLIYILPLITLLFSQLGYTPVSAASNFTVNSTADGVDANPGDGICATAGSLCTLRAAVQETNALGGTNSITLPPGTYTLTIPGANEAAAATGDLNISDSLTIQGAGPGATIINANGLDRALQVLPGAALKLSSLTVENGVASPGGGLAVSGSATITNVEFKNNHAVTGPNNGVGGAIFIDAAASAAIIQSTFTGNVADFGGGAVGSTNGSNTFSIDASTFTANSSPLGGGAVYPNGFTATVTNSTFVGNFADTGGALHSNAAATTVTNSTFIGNSAVNHGAIDSRVGNLTINNSTFYGNTASGLGNTIGVQNIQGGSMSVSNSILYGSTTSSAPNCDGGIADSGNNLSWPAGNNCPGTQADPLLGPLTNNGGSTSTLALAAASPAAGAGNNATCAPADQRGVARPQGAACDIGAFEANVNYFIVANANDSGAGSLRQAILDANATPNTAAGLDQIQFNIPGTGLQTIAPVSALPAVTAPLSIDGYTQPGAAPNTLAAGDNAALLVQLSGANIAGATALTLTTGSNGSTVRGLVINQGFGIGILVNSGANGTTLQGNFIGTSASGTAAAANGAFGLYQAGILVDTAANTQIGGVHPADRNVVSGNQADGIALWNSGVTGTTIQGNYIGVGADGTTALGNGGSGGAFGVEGGGITLRNYIANTTIGGAAPGAGNIIANNGPYGIVDYSGSATIIQGNTISGQTNRGVFLGGAQETIVNNTISGNKGPGLYLTGNLITVQNNVITANGAAGVVVAGGANVVVIRSNSIFNNAGIGIDLGNDGATFDHTGTIPGPNNYQNYPVLNLATSDGTSLRAAGSLVSAPGQTYTIDLYADPVCDPTSFGQGQTYLGSFPVTTDANGQASFDQTIAASVAEPNVVTATATGNNGTSEFSYCLPVATPNLNWVQALAVGSSSQTQQYFTGRFQEKWFKFPVQPGDKVTVTLAGLPGSAISLHTDPNLIYNSLVNPLSAAALSAAAADSAFLPSGSLPSGSLPSGSLPSGSLPSGSLPSGSLNNAFLPSGSLPSGSLPSGSLPSGSLPSGSLPSGSLPSGSLPSGSLPSGSLPSGSLPSGSLPSGSLPSGSLPSGSLPSGSLPSGSLPSGSLPSGSLPSGSLPSGSLAAYASAARQSLLGIAMDPTATVQTVSRDTYDLQGYLYVRVVGPFSLSTPFTVQVTVNGGVCSALQPVPSTLAVMTGAPQGSGLQTLILTDSSRLSGTAAQISAALADLQTLAVRPEVGGVVIDLHDAQYQRLAWANAQADQNPACPSAKNAVAAEIKAIIDAYRSANTSNGSTTLQYIVLAGGASVIPYYQATDVAGLANEKDYVAPVAPSTPSEAGTKDNLVEGQDFYGSSMTLTQGGFTLAMPGLAVGRLVDTATDISTAVHTYIATNGVITPHSSLVTGYDFVADAAQHITDELNAGTASTADTLIQPVGQPPSGPNAWTAAQLLSLLQASKHDIISFSGHFSAGNLLASDYTTNLSAAQIASSSVNLTNVLVLALGCHSGYSIPSPDLLAGASPSPDWAKAFLEKGAAGYVASTAYAYGDTDLTAYGEMLFWNLAQQLRTGSGPVSVGQALTAAKRQYLAQTAQMTGIDQKTLIETSLYGLPMMKVNMPGQRILPPVETSSIPATSPVTGGPAVNGLSSASLSVNPTLSTVNVPLQNLATQTQVIATYLSGANGVTASPFQPILPKQIYDVSVAGLVLRGVALRGGSYSDLAGIVPLTSAATTETSAAHLSFNTPVFYPTQTWMENFTDAFNGGNTRLVAIPAQFKSSAPGAIDGTLRQFSNLTLQLYYLPGSWTGPNSPADVKAAAVSPAPSVLAASALVNPDGSVTFSANAAADGPAGVQAVWVLYTGKPGSPYYGAWTPLDLAPNAQDPTLWQGTLTLQAGANPQDLQFMVQAVGGAGLTTLATNQGAFYSIAPANAAQLPPPLQTFLSLQNPPASGTYLKTSTFTLALSTASGPLANQPVTLDIGGQQALAITDSNGQATLSIQPVITPGSYTAQASFNGSPVDLSAYTYSPFVVNPDSTTVAVTPATPAAVEFNNSLAGQPTPFTARVLDSSGRPLAGRSVFYVIHNATTWFVRTVIADYQGSAPLGAVPLPVGVYTVDVYFNGAIPVSPTTSVTLSDPDYASSMAAGATLILQDTTPPAVSASATRADNTPYSAGAWTNQSVTVHFSCSDSGSGVAFCPPDQTFSSDGVFAASGTARDNAGNNTPVTFQPIKIDKTAPAIVAAATTPPGLAGWYNSPVAIHFTCSDAGSGIPAGSCPTDQILSAEGNAVSSTAATVTDAAGNVSAPSNVVTVKIDRTAPASSGSVLVNGNQATVTLAASDALSGVSATFYSINGGPQQTYSGPFSVTSAGTDVVTFFSKDNAGNTEPAKTLTFIILSLLDNFNRANGSVGSSWGGLTNLSFYQINTNQLNVQLGGPIYWKAAFGTSQGAYVTLKTINPNSKEMGLLLKVQTSSVPQAGAIAVVYDAVAKAVRVETLRLNALTWTLYPNQSASFSNGDRLGATVLSNGTVQIYKNGTLVATVTLNAADQAFFDAKGGSIGLWSVNAPNAYFDDFGGGTLAP